MSSFMTQIAITGAMVSFNWLMLGYLIYRGSALSTVARAVLYVILLAFLGGSVFTLLSIVNNVFATMFV